MQCNDVREQLAALLDGELSPAAAAAVRRHVDACGRCALSLEEAKRVKRLLDQSSVPETVSLAARIMDCVTGEAEDAGSGQAALRVKPAARRRMVPRSRTFMWRAAAAALLVASILTVHLILREPAESPTDRIVDTAGSLFDDVSRAVADVGRGMSAVPEDVVRGAAVAWIRVAENTPSSRISRAVDESGRFLEGGLEGVAAMLKRVSEMEGLLSSTGEDTAGP